MGLETGDFIDDLVQTNPVSATDSVKEGSDHLRLLKKVLLQSFPGIDAAMTLTSAQLNDAALKSVDQTIDGEWTFSAALTALSYGGILEGNLVDKVAAESISGLWSHTADLTMDATGVQERQILFDRDGLGEWQLTNNATSDLTLARRIAGAFQGISLTFFNATGVVQLGAPGTDKRFSTGTTGTITVFSDDNLDTGFRAVSFAHADGTVRGSLGQNGGTTLDLINNINGGILRLRIQDSIGTKENVISANESTVTVGDVDIGLAQYLAGSTHSFQVGGAEVAEFLQAVQGAMLIKDIGGVKRKVGFRNPSTVTIATNRTFQQSDEQTFIEVGASGLSYTVDPLEAGTQIDIVSGGNGVTIVQGGGVTLSFLDGSGSPPSGTRAIAQGSIVHLNWNSSTFVQIWGNGIT